ncbi:MAG: DUF4831 family protein [Bacteroidota bacterium]|nr:DUF4831 family protein [Bacteroidota bacterium]
MFKILFKKISTTPVIPVFLILSTIVFSSCSTELKILSVDKIISTEDVLIYNLPKTSIVVTAEAEKIINRRGPFADYAELYFQSNTNVKENTTEYRLKSIRVETVPLPDPNHYYGIVNGDKFSVAQRLILTPELFLIGINTAEEYEFKPEKHVIHIADETNKKPEYADLSVNSVLETVYDTVWTEVYKDSVFQKIPQIYRRKQFKSPKTQAKDLANQIFKLRDDRLALLKGVTDANNFPDGAAVQLMLQELNRYERQYMTMFTGQKTKHIKTYRFIYTPEDTVKNETVELFKFSKKYGILPPNVNAGEPVKLVLKKEEEDLRALSDLMTYKKRNTGKKPTSTGLVYRIPAIVSINMKYKEKIHFNRNFKIAQLGVLNRIPVQIAGDPNTEIIFYPELGSLKKISSKGIK